MREVHQLVGRSNRPTDRTLRFYPALHGWLPALHGWLPGYPATPCSLPVRPNCAEILERQRSTGGAARSIAAGVWGDGAQPMEGAMAGDGRTVSRGVRMGVGSDGRPME